MVTIIMPAYNCERYLRSAVASVMAQTYKDWTLFIIDDRSTDNTFSLAKELGSMDERIKVFHNKINLGVARTRNMGVKIAKSDWIAFLDSDDMWEPEKLEKQMSLSEKIPNAKILFTGSQFIDKNGQEMDYILHIPSKVNRKGILKQNVVSCSSVLVKRDLMLNYSMPEKQMIHEDFASWLGILSQEKYAYGIDEPLLIYRKSDESKSGNKVNSAKMNWNTYRYVGLDVVSAAYYMCWYTIRGILKYRHLR